LAHAPDLVAYLDFHMRLLQLLGVLVVDFENCAYVFLRRSPLAALTRPGENLKA
jgi:hypothetical protein